MWDKKKNKTIINNSQADVQGGSSRTSAVRTSGNITEIRTEQSYTSTRRVITSTSSITNTSRFSSILPSQTTTNTNQVVPKSKYTASLRSLPDVPKPKPLSRTIFQHDAIPITSSTVPSATSGGYVSPFHRQLQPFRSNPEIARPSSPRYSSPALSLPSEVPTYLTNGRRRGKVLIINNVNFLDDNSERQGAEKDEENLSFLFRSMGFEVKQHKNLKKQGMMDKIKKFRSDKDLEKVDISIVILMSHGNNKRGETIMPGGYTEISGTDGKGLSIDDVLDEFDTNKCTGMRGKPKIFIFQCCRGDQTELQADAKPIHAFKAHADMLVAHSTLPGFFSLRDPQKGSWYIQGICNVFKDNAKIHDVESMLKMVDEQLSRNHPAYKQTTSYESRGFKRCYLNPTN